MKARILITGAGGAAAVSIVKALRADDHDLVMADMDPHAAGLYLVPAEDRVLLPRASAETFVPALLAACIRHRIDLLIPTVDAEMIPVARAHRRFNAVGIRVLSADTGRLETVLDKFRLATALAGVIPVPRTELLDGRFDPATWSGPAVAKPRRGAGSRGIHVFERLPDRLSDHVPVDGSYIIQEFLPGAEYSVDVLADANGRPLAAVPRERMKVDSGIAVTARTVADRLLEAHARAAVEALRLPFVSNVQLRRDHNGVPCLLEINPRFPGTMPLTVAAGVNMPRLAVRAGLGLPMPSEQLTYREVAVVRFWTERFVNPSELVGQAESAVPSAA